MATVTTTGASFTSGKWSFDPWPCNKACYNGRISGWNYSGTLKDTLADGASVEVKGKIDGYSWATSVKLTAGKGKSRAAAQKIYVHDPAQQGRVRLQRVRPYTPDNWVDAPWKYRKWHLSAKPMRWWSGMGLPPHWRACH